MCEGVAYGTYFATSHAFTESFDPTISSPQMLSDVQTLQEADLVSSLRILFEAFYEIALRDGLPRDVWGNTGKSFDRARFVEMFKEENYGRVCPLCDGDMNGPEVDHWLPKSKYPALSCHPKNLVPVCNRCNSRACKGEQFPLDIGDPRPFDNWFHPYDPRSRGTEQLARILETGVKSRYDESSQEENRGDSPWQCRSTGLIRWPICL